MNQLLKVFGFLIFIGLISCNHKRENQNSHQYAQTGSEDHSAHRGMEMSSTEPTDESIYNVESYWKNRNGHEIALDELRGNVQIIAMVYTNCEYACPRILADMKRIENEFSDEELQKVNFLIVSIDPERDTPERLSKFATENNLGSTTWTLLNGDQGDILELSALLGVKYKRISETDFTHSNMLTVLNQEGEIIHQRMKLGNETDTIVQQIRQVL
jgi:protein SCO1/2